MSGKIPDSNDWLNKRVNTGAILLAVPLSIFAEMPSGPFALEVSRDVIILYTSSSVQSRVSVDYSKSDGSA